MSQEKVDRYKRDKATRQETLQKEKRKAAIIKGVMGVVCVAVIIWVAWSAFYTIHGPIVTNYEVVTDSMESYLETLSD